MNPLTLKELAALTGMSCCHLSRAIKHPARKRMRHGTARTDDVPNMTARLLVEGRQPLIAIVVTEPAEVLFGNPELARIIDDITAACRTNRCLCALYLLNGTEMPHALHTPQVDGVIVVGSQTDEVVTQLQTRRPPGLMLGRTTRSDVLHVNPVDGSDVSQTLALRQFMQAIVASQAGKGSA